jgi:hypothetical protein
MNGELEGEKGTCLETEVDQLYELIKKNGIVKVKAVAKRFKVKREQIEEWGRILEEHDLAILHYPPFGDPVIILKKFKPKAGVKVEKTGKRRIKNKKAIFINIAILLVFVFFVLWYTGRLSIPLDLGVFSLPDLSGVMDVDEILDILVRNQIYLVLVLIIIIVLLLIFTTKRAGKKGRRKGKHGEGRS